MLRGNELSLVSLYSPPYPRRTLRHIEEEEEDEQRPIYIQVKQLSWYVLVA